MAITPTTLKQMSWQILSQNHRMEKLKDTLTAKGTHSDDSKKTDLKEVCSEFESLFIFQLFKEMRATIPKTGFLDGGKAEEVYTSLLDAELAQNLSKREGIGLASLLFKQLYPLHNKKE